MRAGITSQKTLFLGLSFFLIVLISCSSKQDDKLTIAVAANLQFAIEDLVEKFSEQTGLECEIIVGSSGKLTAQIIEGAPFDLFLSADLKYPKTLYERGFTEFEPDIYAHGNLILWTLRKDIEPDLESLTKKDVRHIAIGNPKTAPYGLSAMEVIKRLGIEASIRNKLVFGESVSQTNQFIISEAADLGFTSKSVVMSPQMHNQGSWKEIDKSLYQPMAQGMVILKAREAFRTKSIQFRDFILSEEGKEILHKFGYQIEFE
jgi:molybdate transport system substrate-binding protein